MKKKLQKYLSGEREGFSLVELIIVIAIMAILIGVIALAVLPYLEKSRVGKDQQTVDTVYSAFQTAIADQKITANITVTIPRNGTATATPANNNFLSAMAEALNANDASDLHQGTTDKLESKGTTESNAKITCTYVSGTKTITVKVEGNDDIATSLVSSNKKTS